MAIASDETTIPFEPVTPRRDVFTYAIHTEKCLDDFTAQDTTVKFYNFVQAILLRTKARDVLDFGAGRGAEFVDGTSEYRRHLRDLRKFGAHVTACDVDGIVLSHPASDQQIVIESADPLPFADASFDVIVADYVFEHIEKPEFAAKELLRILRPGGFICARTTNKFGYVALAARLIPDSLHTAMLRRVKPHRKQKDSFPTFYRMNSLGEIKRLFRNCKICHYHDSSDPSYYFGSSLIYRTFMIVHRLLPKALDTSFCVFIQKR